MLKDKRLFLKNFFGLSFFLFLFVLLPSPQSQIEASQERDIVLRVVDGDTLTVEHKGQKENLRLIGIDTPESQINKKARKDAVRSKKDIETITSLGREATRFVKTLIRPGDQITIEFDQQRRDKYGRLLGYVYLANGQMLNEEIIKAGYASLMTFPPNVKYQERLARAYREARANNRGLWGKP